MAAPADRVQILKNESVVGGGSAGDTEDGFPTQLDPTEDAPEVQGFFIQPSGGPKDELVWITRDGSGNMILRDVADGTERTLSSLVAGGFDVNAVLVDDVTGDSLTDDMLGNLLVNQ